VLPALLLLVISQAPPTGSAPTLEDLKFFAHHEHKEVAWRSRLSDLFFSYVTVAVARDSPKDVDLYRASRDQFRIRRAWDEL
jgi:hypothetical protein